MAGTVPPVRTLGYTGRAQRYVVPGGVTLLLVDAVGALGRPPAPSQSAAVRSDTGAVEPRTTNSGSKSRRSAGDPVPSI